MLSSREKMSRARIALERGGNISSSLINQTISDSWQRCFKDGLDPKTKSAVEIITASELKDRYDELEDLRRFAKVEMENLYRQISGSNFMIALGDTNGIVLDTLSDREFESSSAGKMLIPGSVWSESTRGTNALGTCAITKSPTVVHGHEHYCSSHSNVSCIASPIFHTDGRLAGVLDASSYCGSRQQHTMALITMAATQIENSLFIVEQNHNLVLMFHSRDELMNSLSGALMSVDGQGHIIAFNRRCYELLYGLGLTSGIVFDDIFDSSVEEILTYFQGSPHGYITDKLGSSYLARWLNLSHKKFPGEKKAALVASLPALNTTPIDGFIANDLTLIRQLKKAERGSNLKVPMLILGETGTGKEMMAQYIHSVSRRRGKLIPVNCGAIAKDILEAELFGYEPGAFTGAKKEGSSGLFGAADGGTIFFDEIADLPMNAQVALLRFLDCGEIRRVGGHQIFKADVQVLTATNSDLQQAAENGRFRADLYYRINVLEILIPPIRDRTDFPHLVHHLISTISADISISYEAIERLATHSWPGNMRELRSVLTRVILSTESAHIDLKAIEKFFLDSPIDILATKKLSLHSKKIETIRRCVSEHGGNVSKAARSLGISRTTIYKHLDVVWSRVSE